MEQLLTEKRKFESFDPVELINNLTFFYDFKGACDKDGERKGTAMWLFHLFIKKLAGAVLNDCICLKQEKKRHEAKGSLTTYCELFKYLISIHTTNDIITETNAEMTTSKQPKNMKPVE